jgi:hypothetical protein
MEMEMTGLYPSVEVAVKGGGESRGLKGEIALDDELAHELVREQHRRALTQLVGVCAGPPSPGGE